MRRKTAAMCRLDVDSAALKKEVEPAGADAALPSRLLSGRGQKRKGSISEEVPHPQHQRQLVLELCVEKLQTLRRRPEPSLRRSVLLANTLRRLQRESPAPAPPTPPEADAPFDSTGYLSDLPLDDIFEDIDTSMYEASDAPPELKRCLTDLSELDHIMEVLVRC